MHAAPAQWIGAGRRAVIKYQMYVWQLPAFAAFVLIEMHSSLVVVVFVSFCEPATCVWQVAVACNFN